MDERICLKVNYVKYTITLANNLVMLFPDLPHKVALQSASALTIEEIAAKIGVSPLLLVGGLIHNTLCRPDHRIEEDAEIVLLGPVAGG